MNQNSYHKSDELLLEGDSQAEITNYYAEGYLLGRIKPHYIYQTRSLRINLTQFSLNSENRRVLRKAPLQMSTKDIPLVVEDSWKYYKLIKDFYSEKQDTKFSAAKARDILAGNFDFNSLEVFEGESQLGYAICYQNEKIKHYCYPFYDLEQDYSNLGMAMMLNSIIASQEAGLKYHYLGGATRQQDRYKLQFSGLEWWDGATWHSDIETLKEILLELS